MRTSGAAWESARVDVDLQSLVILAVLAVRAPIVADVPRRFRVAIVVVEILLGIIVGPDVLDLVQTDPFIDALASTARMTSDCRSTPTRAGSHAATDVRSRRRRRGFRAGRRSG